MAVYKTDANKNLIKVAGNFNPSYDVSQLVKEVTVTTATQSIIIENLDIIRDGGVYDFVLEGCNSTTQDSVVYIRFNGKDNSRYFGSLMANNNSGLYGGVDNSVSQARVGVFAQNPSLVTGTISFPMSCPLFNSTSFDVQSNMQVVTFGGGYYDALSNVTAIRFNNQTTFAVGTKVKIYKRMANATVSKTNGVKFERLWVNPNPNASFSAQTVNLSSSDWDYLMITTQASNSHARNSVNIFSKSSPSSVGLNMLYATTSSSYGPVNFVRNCNIVSTNGNPATSYSQVYFEDCHEGYNNAEITDNRSCIPNEIIGIKVV